MKIKLFTFPNFLTLLNLLCGSMAVMYCFRDGDLKMAFWLIILSAVFDFFDGFAARLLKSYSEVGKQLDSLADMVSFGLAPGAILYVIYSQSMGDERFVPAVFIITLFSALRLAKFNVDTRQSEEFIGLPTPAATLFVSSSGYLFAEGMFAVNPYYVLGVGACLAALLVGNNVMFALKFKNFSLKDNALRYSFLVVSLVAMLVFKIVAIPFIIMLYILISYISALLSKK
ncbi:MAG: CDP-diacylglycerol--serine O-phosphatidyltransferase [Rikenellaceae bacterium]